MFITLKTNCNGTRNYCHVTLVDSGNFGFNFMGCGLEADRFVEISPE